MALDAQSLLATAHCYRCYGDTSVSRLLRLGLLVNILNTLNPMQATDPQSLLKIANCYGSYSDASVGTMFELALLNLIAQNIGSGSGSSLSAYYAAPGPPTGTPAANGLLNIIVDSNGRQWQYWGGAWQ